METNNHMNTTPQPAVDAAKEIQDDPGRTVKEHAEMIARHYAPLVERAKELEAQNITFRNAQKACEDCMTPTYAALRAEPSEANRKLGEACFSPQHVSADNESLPEGCQIVICYVWRHRDGLEGWPFAKKQDAIDSAWKRWGAEHDAIKLSRQMQDEPRASRNNDNQT